MNKDNAKHMLNKHIIKKYLGELLVFAIIATHSPHCDKWAAFASTAVIVSRSVRVADPVNRDYVHRVFVEWVAIGSR